jgi:plastocyanin
MRRRHSMRFLFVSLALGVGSLGLIPDSTQACDHPGGPVYYAPAYSGYYQPVYSGYYQPMYTAYDVPGGLRYYGPGAYYAPGGYFHQRSGLQPSVPYQSLYPPAAMPQAPATTTDVTITDNKFEPATVTITAGTAVRWTNKGSHKHTVTSSNDTRDSGDIAAGQDFAATFAKPGTFEYYCRHHKDMKGKVIVK